MELTPILERLSETGPRYDQKACLRSLQMCLNTLKVKMSYLAHSPLKNHNCTA